MDFKTLGFSLKYFNLILIHLVTPAQVTQEKDMQTHRLRWAKFISTWMNFPFKTKQIMYEVWLACVPTYGEIDNPYRKVIQELQSREVTENGL